jgi:hypothetical protein
MTERPEVIKSLIREEKKKGGKTINFKYNLITNYSQIMDPLVGKIEYKLRIQ